MLLTRLDQSRAGERVTAEAQAAALRAADGVRSLVVGLEGQAQNATTNPRLVAALDANVDRETLRDLLLNEPWWEPFRRVVDGFGLYGDETTALVTSRLPHAVRRADDGARRAPGPPRLVRPAGWRAGQVVAVAACPVALNGRSEWPVLVATRILDVGIVSSMAERAGGAVAISDGRRLLVAATTGATGGADDLAALKQAVDSAAPGQVTLGNETVAALPLVGRAARAGRRRRADVGAGGLAAVGSGDGRSRAGLLFAIGLYVVLARAGGATSRSRALIPAPAALRTVRDRPLHDRRSHRPGRHGRDLCGGHHRRRATSAARS